MKHFKYFKKLLALILSLSLVFAGVPAELKGRSFLAPPSLLSDIEHQIFFNSDIPYIQDGEIGCTSKRFWELYVGSEKTLQKKIYKTLHLKNIHKHVVTIAKNGVSVEFFKRKSARYIIWAFNESDIQNVARIIDVQLRYKKEQDAYYYEKNTFNHHIPQSGWCQYAC